MTSRITIYDKNGGFIGDVRGSAPRSWVLNSDPVPGECNIPISIYDDKNSLRYIEFGKYVLVRRSPLPDWIGIIYNRKWSSGYVTVKAIQAEFLLSRRRTPIIDVSGTAGAIFTQLLNYINNEPFNEKPIYPNEIYIASPTTSKKLGADPLTIVQELAAGSGNDFSVLHAFDTNGHLYMTGNWYKRRGIMTDYYLREGVNIQLSDGILEEDARTMVNYLEGRSDASTDGTRISSFQYDEESISRYGLQATSSVFNGVKNKSTVESNTLNLLKASKDPLNTFDVTALEVGETFYKLDIGNVVNLSLKTYGYSVNPKGTSELVEISGMEFNETSCRLIVERYKDA